MPCDPNVGASGNVMSAGLRLPNGSQMSDGLNRNLSEADTTRTSTSPCSSLCTARAAVSPAKFPPRTSTFFRLMTAPLSCASRTRMSMRTPLNIPMGVYGPSGPLVPAAGTEDREQRADRAAPDAALPDAEAVGGVVEEPGRDIADGAERRAAIRPVEQRRREDQRGDRQAQPPGGDRRRDGQRPPRAGQRAAQGPRGGERAAAREAGGQRPCRASTHLAVISSGSGQRPALAGNA